MRAARAELLRRLLEAHERSKAFGQPGPWPRDVIVKVNRKTFPEAFSAEGRESLDALRDAADDLAVERAARVIRHSGALDGELKEVRLGPEELATAYRLGRVDGFVPLAAALGELADGARDLRDGGVPDWMAAFLDRVVQGAGVGDLGVIGMSRLHFKEERRDVLDALAAACALSRGASGWERVVSERIFHDSKRLGAIRTRVIDLLTRADPRWEGVPSDEAMDLLEAYGVQRKPGLIRCAGRAELRVGDRSYRLEDFTPTAHLPDAWASAWVEAVLHERVAQVTTIENEFPFLSYVAERGGPATLGADGEIAVYTAGFPTPALVNALATLAQRAPSVRFRHWGDADVGGVRIWWFLRSRLQHEVALFRTDAAWVERSAAEGARALNETEMLALQKIAKQLTSATGDDIPAAQALVDALRRSGKKIEQERF